MSSSVGCKLESPLTPVDGQNHLALLTEHGYNFKIEAVSQTEKYTNCEWISMGQRLYISTNQGLRRVATKLIMDEQGVLPQFAGTRQKIVEVITERRNGEHFFRASGTYAEFDRDGRVYVSAVC
jgi:hypothetical protein